MCITSFIWGGASSISVLQIPAGSRRLRIAKLRAVGYTQGEISDILNISQQSVSYQLKKLRKEASISNPDILFQTLVAENDHHIDSEKSESEGSDDVLKMIYAQISDSGPNAFSTIKQDDKTNIFNIIKQDAKTINTIKQDAEKTKVELEQLISNFEIKFQSIKNFQRTFQSINDELKKGIEKKEINK